MKTTTLLLAAGILLAFVSFVPMVGATPCGGAVAVNCGGDTYVWCSPNSGSGGYRSSNGTCDPGYTPVPERDPGCTVWMDSRGCVVS